MLGLIINSHTGSTAGRAERKGRQVKIDSEGADLLSPALGLAERGIVFLHGSLVIHVTGKYEKEIREAVQVL
jgi:hypothetical protein